MATHVEQALSTGVDDDVVRYVRALWFEVTWDMSMRRRQRWYEIYDGDRLLCQIDMGIPLANILEDLPHMAEGRVGTSAGPDYEVTCDEDAKLKLICRRIEEKKHEGDECVRPR